MIFLALFRYYLKFIFNSFFTWLKRIYNRKQNISSVKLFTNFLYYMYLQDYMYLQFEFNIELVMQISVPDT